ncbi:MAG: SURF1 family cytochrome oxidase biogenesis protein, partial [Dehalococcoidia bacterium]
STRGEEIVAARRPAGGGPAVLVNLGWIPLGARDDVVPGLVDAPAVVEGLARDPGERSARTIPDGAWTGLSPASMGEALGYPVADWFVFAGPEREGQGALGEALPIQGWQRFTNTTPHIEYALTWFGLALALVAVAVVRLMVEPRRRARDSTPATGAEDDGDGAS